MILYSQDETERCEGTPTFDVAFMYVLGIYYQNVAHMTFAVTALSICLFRSASSP